jgi:hypothetical protein
MQAKANPRLRAENERKAAFLKLESDIQRVVRLAAETLGEEDAIRRAADYAVALLETVVDVDENEEDGEELHGDAWDGLDGKGPGLHVAGGG